MIQIKTSRDKAPEQTEHSSGCLICGDELIYQATHSNYTCAICGQAGSSNVACPKAHYVCDSCHSDRAVLSVMAMLHRSDSKDPIELLEQAFADPLVFMHGPEHHTIVPYVLLTAYKNAGGPIDSAKAMREGYQRSKKVPGGVCGAWGVCGAQIGAGIFASIVTGSNPLNKEAWGIPMKLTARILERLSEIGGPRCCKRTTRIAIEEAAKFSEETLGIKMDCSSVACVHADRNRQCIGRSCPYHPRTKA